MKIEEFVLACLVPEWADRARVVVELLEPYHGWLAERLEGLEADDPDVGYKVAVICGDLVEENPDVHRLLLAAADA